MSDPTRPQPSTSETTADLEKFTPNFKAFITAIDVRKIDEALYIYSEQKNKITFTDAELDLAEALLDLCLESENLTAAVAHIAEKGEDRLKGTVLRYFLTVSSLDSKTLSEEDEERIYQLSSKEEHIRHILGSYQNLAGFLDLLRLFSQNGYKVKSLDLLRARQDDIYLQNTQDIRQYLYYYYQTISNLATSHTLEQFLADFSPLLGDYTSSIIQDFLTRYGNTLRNRDFLKNLNWTEKTQLRVTDILTQAEGEQTEPAAIVRIAARIRNIHRRLKAFLAARIN